MVRVSDRFELCRAQVILLQMHFDLGIFLFISFSKWACNCYQLSVRRNARTLSEFMILLHEEKYQYLYINMAAHGYFYIVDTFRRGY